MPSGALASRDGAMSLPASGAKGTFTLRASNSGEVRADADYGTAVPRRRGGAWRPLKRGDVDLTRVSSRSPPHSPVPLHIQ